MECVGLQTVGRIALERGIILGFGVVKFNSIDRYLRVGGSIMDLYRLQRIREWTDVRLGRGCFCCETVLVKFKAFKML